MQNAVPESSCSKYLQNGLVDGLDGLVQNRLERNGLVKYVLERNGLVQNRLERNGLVKYVLAKNEPVVNVLEKNELVEKNRMVDN